MVTHDYLHQTVTGVTSCHPTFNTTQSQQRLHYVFIYPHIIYIERY